MKTYYFEDLGTGEEFFVEAENKDEAFDKAEEYFTNVKCYGQVSEYVAEMMGLDTY